MKNLINTREALALAVFAFRKNGRVVKEATKDAEVNKLMVWNHFNTLKTNDPQPTIEITEELLEAADGVKTTIEYAITMAMLTKGRIPSFVETMHDTVKEDQVNIKNLGILVWAPKLAQDLQRAQSLKELSAAYELKSKFIGKEGEKIELNFTLIEKRFVRSIDTWSAYGYNDQGNLVKFLSKHEELCATGRIRARIKKHDVDSYHNKARVTVLNFVKAI